MPYDAMGNQIGGDEPPVRSMDEMNLALAQRAKLAAAQMNPMMLPLYMRDAARLGLNMATPTAGAVAGALSNAQAKGAEYLHGLRGDTASAQEARQSMVRPDSPEQAGRFSSPMQTPVGEEFADNVGSAFSALHLPASGPGSGLPGQGKISPRPFITPNDVRVMGADAARIAKQAREIPQDFSNAQSGLQRLDPVTNKPTMGARLQGAADSLGDTLARRESQGLTPVPGLPASLQPRAKMHAVRPKSQTNFAPDPVYGDPIQRELFPLKKTVSRFENPNLSIEQVELQNKANEPLNNWIDKKLGSYFKNELGTPEDSVLKLHGQGITHLPKDILELGSWLPEELAKARTKIGFNEKGEAVKRHADAGYPEENEANTRMAEQFENLSDNELTSIPASYINDELRDQNPWLKKLSSNVRLNEFSNANNLASNLGFDHVVDVLREQIADGTLDPKKLDKVSVSDAIKRTHDYNIAAEEARVKSTIEDKKHANIVYENPEGIIVKLEKPGQFAKESDVMGHSVRGYEPPKDHPDYVKASGKGGSLAYGHGGWDAIRTGKAEVYSVRDPNNKSYGTIEVQADIRPRESYSGEPKLNITQIKGPENGKIDPVYTGLVKDFLNKGNWGNVANLDNIGLTDLKDYKSFSDLARDIAGKNRKVTDVEQQIADIEFVDKLPRFVTRSDIIKALEPKPVEHKMLQGVYRGFAGENPNTPELSTTPQKRVADFYAQKRAEQTGQTPHAEMLLIDPFAGKTSGHSIPGTGGQEPLFTNKRTIKPTDVKSRTQLYAKGGGVTAKPNQSVDQMRYALLRNR